LLGDADIALAPYVVIVTVKTRARGEMLTSMSAIKYPRSGILKNHSIDSS
jgi:hypothetical protein